MESWRPNWEIEEEYAFTAELSLSGWAWEFVKRNPEYQAFWEECAEGLRRSQGWLEQALGREPAKEPTPISDIYGGRSEECRKRWGFYPPAAPKTPIDVVGALVVFVGRSGSPLPPAILRDWQTMLSAMERVPEGEKLGHLRFATLDLSVKLGPQIRYIEAVARAEQDRAQEREGLTPRRSEVPSDKSPWVRCLRVLDARAKGVTYKEIAVVLFPDEELGELGAIDPDIGPVKTALDEARKKYQPESYLRFQGLPV